MRLRPRKRNIDDTSGSAGTKFLPILLSLSLTQLNFLAHLSFSLPDNMLRLSDTPELLSFLYSFLLTLLLSPSDISFSSYQCCGFTSDPDPTCHFDADPDTTFHFDAV